MTDSLHHILEAWSQLRIKQTEEPRRMASKLHVDKVNLPETLFAYTVTIMNSKMHMGFKNTW